MADSGIKEAFTSTKGSDDGKRGYKGDEARISGTMPIAYSCRVDILLKGTHGIELVGPRWSGVG